MRTGALKPENLSAAFFLQRMHHVTEHLRLHGVQIKECNVSVFEVLRRSTVSSSSGSPVLTNVINVTSSQSDECSAAQIAPSKNRNRESERTEIENETQLYICVSHDDTSSLNLRVLTAATEDINTCEHHEVTAEP